MLNKRHNLVILEILECIYLKTNRCTTFQIGRVKFLIEEHVNIIIKCTSYNRIVLSTTYIDNKNFR